MVVGSISTVRLNPICQTMRLSRVVRLLALFAIPALASTPQFNPRQDINTNFQHLSGLAIGDFNGDGKLDIAVSDVSGKQILVYLNNGSGSFSAPISTTLQISADGVGSIVVGDFNEDGKQDLIVGTVAGSQADIFLSGNGDGTFTQQQVLPGSFGFFSAAVVDINHDSHLDLIAGGNGTLYVHLGDGHGNFTCNLSQIKDPVMLFLASSQPISTTTRMLTSWRPHSTKTAYGIFREMEMVLSLLRLH